MDKNVFCCFYPLIFFCLACLEYGSPHTVVIYHVLSASRRAQAFKEKHG